MTTTAPEAASPSAPPANALRRGYRFWGLVVVVILAVEGAGAIRGSRWYEEHVLEHHSWATIPWTTISGMVGHLEELFPGTAVFVVAIIAPVAFYALAPTAASEGHSHRAWPRALRLERARADSLVLGMGGVRSLGRGGVSRGSLLRRRLRPRLLHLRSALRARNRHPQRPAAVPPGTRIHITVRHDWRSTRAKRPAGEAGHDRTDRRAGNPRDTSRVLPVARHHRGAGPVRGPESPGSSRS